MHPQTNHGSTSASAPAGLAPGLASGLARIQRARRDRQPRVARLRGHQPRFRSRRGSLLMLAALAGAYPVQFTVAQVRGNPVDTLPQQRESEPVLRTEIEIKQRVNPQDNLMAVKVMPRGFAIEGVQSIPFAAVAAKFEPFTGKAVTVGELVKATEAVNALYQEAGYALSFAFIPSQDFASGIVKVTVVEGYVSGVRVEGDLGNMEEKVRAIAAHITAEKPLKRATFERYINILGTLPGLGVAASVPPPLTTDGASELVLKTTRKRFALETGVEFNHPGVQGIVTGVANGITSAGDQATVSAIPLPGKYQTRYFAGSYSLPLGSDGAAAKIDAYTYRSHPADMVIGALAFARVVDTKKLTLALTYPLILSNTERLIVSGGAYANDYSDRYTSRATSASVALETQVRAVFAELAYAASKQGQSRQAGAAIYQGFNALGAGQANVGRDLNFTRARVRFAQSNDWASRFTTTVAATAQFSGQRLPSTEQISFGGMQFGRAYPAGEVAGDSGWGASGEIAKQFPVSMGPLKAVTPYILVDAARAYRNGGVTLQHSRLGSAGVGLRLSDGGRNSIDFSLAVPVGERPVSNSRAPRANLLYSVQF